MALLRAATRGDDKARDRLITCNLRFVARIAHRFMGMRGGLEFRDLISYGIVGLIRAIEKFEPERGLRLSTFSSWWIRQAIRRSCQDHAEAIRIPVHMLESRGRVARAKARIRAATGREASTGELAAVVRRRPKVVEAVAHLPARPVSLDAGGRGVEGAESLHAVVADDSPGPLASLETRERENMAMALLSSLAGRDGGGRDAHVIARRFYGDGDGSTLQEIATDLGLSRERIRQLEAEALGRMRADALSRGW